ncbi:MAG: hypothetical protein ACRDMV_22450 [Streptosporangiales bacterium]
MQLAFVLYPERDLAAGVQRWQRCGLRPLWWPDADTVILGAGPGSVAEVMLEDDPAEHRLGPGPVFVVDDVDAFRSGHRDLDWSMEPCDVPAGRYAAFTTADGSAVRLLDLRNDLGDQGALFRAP